MLVYHIGNQYRPGIGRDWQRDYLFCHQFCGKRNIPDFRVHHIIRHIFELYRFVRIAHLYAANPGRDLAPGHYGLWLAANSALFRRLVGLLLA